MRLLGQFFNNHKMTHKIWCAFFVCLSVTVEGSRLLDRSVSFEDFREGKSLVGFVIRSIRDVSRRKCVALCLQTPTCLSLHFVKHRSYQLNSGDAFTYGSQFGNDPNSIYVGMKREEVPKCIERGKPVNVLNAASSQCQINQKIQDAIPGELGKKYG